jgi:hypothetical protein
LLVLRSITLTSALVVLPWTAVAQSSQPSSEDTLVAHRLVLNVELPDAMEETGSASSGTQAPAAPAPLPPERDRRRRPSMVGYINDGSIGSGVRVRFDAGYGFNAVDRAEFFYAKCGCYRDLPSDHPFFDAAAPGPGPGIVTDLNFQQLYVLGEYAMNPRVSVYGELPLRWIQPQAFVPGAGSFDNQSGLSDIRLGLKAAAVDTSVHRVTLQLQANAPTGDPRRGMGSDRWSVEPAVLYAASLTDRLVFESQFGGVLPTSGSAGLPTAGGERFDGRVLYYGAGASYQLARTNTVEFAPVVELVGWRVLGGFQTLDFLDVSGMNITNLKVGGRVTVRGGSSFYVGYGRALGDNWWYQDVVRAEYRLGF